MKLIIILLTASFLHAGAAGYSQSVTLSVKNAPLEKVMFAIYKQTGYTFAYEASIIQKAKPVTLNVDNAPLREVLNYCFRDQPLTYEIDEKIILVKEREPNSLSKIAIENTYPKNIKGRVTNEKEEPLNGVTVTERGTKNTTATDENGEFSLFDVNEKATILFSFVGYATHELKLGESSNIVVQLKLDVGELGAVTVISTGYETVSPERATGSFVKIDNELINRSVSTNILDRLNGVASGVLFNSSTSDLGFSIRGRSTIFANTNPLVVLDNFPYDGDLSTINPNDVESITILRDAAAASIWGVRAGNGVVVITTKKGGYNQKMKVTFNSNVTLAEKPDLFGRPEMSTQDVIELERFLFEKGAYDNAINTGYSGISPVVQILLDQRNGAISDQEANTQISSLVNLNNKEDYLNYLYRTTINQQYSINLNGGGNQNKYYFSVGYDKNLQSTKPNFNDRITLTATNSFKMLQNKLEFNIGVNFSIKREEGNSGISSVNRPYQMLKDEQGNSLNIYPYRKSWLDTIGNGRLLNWSLYPFEELSRQTTKNELTTYLISAGVKYNFTNWLSASVIYQYSKGTNEINNLFPASSFYTRDLINQFSQINYTTGNVTRPVPIGDIFDISSYRFYSHNVRAQMSFDKLVAGKHKINAILGAEAKDYKNLINTSRYYGYNEELGTIALTDYVQEFPLIFYSGARSRIPGSPSQTGSSDRYISFYSNAAYTYSSRYTLSFSARKDESNLFGVEANNKGVPLMSVGLMWTISNENFFRSSSISHLRLRLTNGFNGNVDKSASAFTTARVSANNPFGESTFTILNPPNPALRWEKINMSNLALDYGILNDRINGSFEYYFKKGLDIIGDAPLPPSSGVTRFRGNSADVKGSGFDLTLNTRNFNKEFKWATTFLLSYNKFIIDKYKVKTTPLGFREGYPYNALFSYRSAGLDPTTGDPQGYLNGNISKAWATIINKDSVSNLEYHGSAVPTLFGSLLNTFRWHNLTLSFNITYKFGYYFRRKTVNYFAMINGGQIIGHQDYSNRWQKPGDELNTDIPSLVYPVNNSRETFYTNSNVLVERGDIIRFQDVQISYDLSKTSIPKLPFQLLRFYLYANQLGLIWRANSKQLDPDFQDIPPQRTIALGVRIDF